jgi:SAM-dependent methyltransferase
VNHFLHGVTRAIAEAFSLPGPILEIGSYQVAGQEEIAELRELFPGRAYIGVDRRNGPGVDLQADVEALPHADASVGTVIAMNTFEHVPRFWRGFEEIRRVLRPDGALLISCPFFFKIHNYPGDYWRFTPAALELLLEDYPSKLIGWHGAKSRPAHVWALALGEHRQPITQKEFACYRRFVTEYARQPVTKARRWAYGLGSLFFGRGLFAPRLDQERWETICCNSNVRHCRIARQAADKTSQDSEVQRLSMSPSASPTGTAASCCADAWNP